MTMMTSATKAQLEARLEEVVVVAAVASTEVEEVNTEVSKFRCILLRQLVR